MVETYKTPLVKESEKRASEFEKNALTVYKDRAAAAYNRIYKILESRDKNVLNSFVSYCDALDKKEGGREKILMLSFLNRVANWDEARAFEVTRELVGKALSGRVGNAYDEFMVRAEAAYGKSFKEFLEAALQTPPYGRTYSTSEKFIIALGFHFSFMAAFPRETKELAIDKIGDAFARGATDTQRMQVEAEKTSIIVQQRDAAADGAARLFLLPLVGGASAATSEGIVLAYKWITDEAKKRFGQVQGTINLSKEILARRNANNLYSQIELSTAIGALGDAQLDIKGPLKVIFQAIEDRKIKTPSQVLDLLRFVYVCTTVTKQEPTAALKSIIKGIEKGTFKSDSELTKFVDTMDAIFRVVGKKVSVGERKQWWSLWRLGVPGIVEKTLKEAEKIGVEKALENATKLIKEKGTLDTRIYKKTGIEEA